jgi:hypothetical protein
MGTHESDFHIFNPTIRNSGPRGERGNTRHHLPAISINRWAGHVENHWLRYWELSFFVASG